MRIFAVVLVLSAPVAHAATWDNEAGIYTLPPLPSAEGEGLRLDTTQREDQQPLGRTVRAGDQVTIGLPDLPAGVGASLIVGFRPMWGHSLDQQIERLGPGETQITATQDGPLFLRLTGAGPEIAVRLTGGDSIPLYVDGAMTAADWQVELDTHKGAGFVQLVGDRALITLPSDVYQRAPIPEPAASFAMINRVLALEDGLSGLDGADPLDEPSPLRQHFLVDFRASAEDRQNFYMYATDGYIGLLPDNSSDLTNPDLLQVSWGPWHEIGHIEQPYSWTWGALTEINTNIWSLYVEESLGNPSRLAETDAAGKTTLARARDYLGAGGGVPDYLIDDSDTLFIRLVMFHQLRVVYGWDLFRTLNQQVRRDLLPRDATDQDKVDLFVRLVCTITGHDLRGFFDRWGLRATAPVLAEIGQLNLPLPPIDPAREF